MNRGIYYFTIVSVLFICHYTFINQENFIYILLDLTLFEIDKALFKTLNLLLIWVSTCCYILSIYIYLIYVSLDSLIKQENIWY